MNIASGGFNALTVGGSNTAIGLNTLLNNSSGINNTASGYQALYGTTTGSYNTATGFDALFSDTSGNFNTATGFDALFANSTGANNRASGQSTLGNNTTGSNNTANGTSALLHNTNGSRNTGTGQNALSTNTTGNNNTALGADAGNAITNGSNNIDIGNQELATVGTSVNSGVIRIGTSGTQTSFFAAGINNSTVSGAPVLVDGTTGQLGVASSSRRYKEDVHNMADASDGLLRLRPVTFRYLKPYADGSKPLDYGLIAEEVAEVYPELVVKSPDGQIETVQYQKRGPMLLNELQKLETRSRLS